MKRFSLVLFAVVIIIVIGVLVLIFTPNKESESIPSPTTPSIKAVDLTHTPLVVTLTTSTSTFTPIPTATVTVTPNPEQIAQATLIPTANPSFTVTTRITDLGIEQVWVPSGSFMAGDQAGIGYDDETPHQVYTDEFWIDRFLVTNAQFAQCPEAICGNPLKTGSHKRPEGYYGVSLFSNYPVIEINWQQANSFCQWRNARLPTEAEYEKAAGWDPSTGAISIYPWGNNPPNDNLANYNGIDRDTQPVDYYSDGVSKVGAYDMAGNVWEWTLDWYDKNYYLDNKDWINPSGPVSGDFRVIRGGSWFSIEPLWLRVSNRGTNRPENAGNEIGFRCVSEN